MTWRTIYRVSIETIDGLGYFVGNFPIKVGNLIGAFLPPTVGQPEYSVADLLLSAVRLCLMAVICPSTAVKLLSNVLRRWFRLIWWPSAVAK